MFNVWAALCEILIAPINLSANRLLGLYKIKGKDEFEHIFNGIVLFVVSKNWR